MMRSTVVYVDDKVSEFYIVDDDTGLYHYGKIEAKETAKGDKEVYLLTYECRSLHNSNVDAGITFHNDQAQEMIQGVARRMKAGGSGEVFDFLNSLAGLEFVSVASFRMTGKKD